MAPGGKRKGAGRPKGPPTKVLSVRVPAQHYAYLKAVVVALVAKLAKGKPRAGRAAAPIPQETP